MRYTIRIKVRIINPSWNSFFTKLLRSFLLPPLLLFLLIIRSFGINKLAMNKSLDFVNKVMLVIIAIPLGLCVLAVLFGIPVVLFFAGMGWIQ